MTPGKGIRILSIADDDGIRFSRELVLKQEGYEVESTTSNTTLRAEKVRSFHIAILCHSLPADRAEQIAENLRHKNPSIRVLRVHALRSQPDRLYDVDCEVLPGPGPLLNAIQALCTRLSPGANTGKLRRA